MGCNCGKKKVAAQPKKIVKPQNIRENNIKKSNVLKRVIRRSAY